MVKIYDNPSKDLWRELTTRNSLVADKTVAIRVAQIIDRVKAGGDKAVLSIAEEIDCVKLTSLKVTSQEINESCARVDNTIKKAILVAKANIYSFHYAQRMNEIDIDTMPGVRCLQRPVPIQNVGLYIPGGSAPLFSTVLMLAVPAKIAGCKNVVLCSPSNKDGKINDVILYAAHLCGIDNIYKIGGAQAIASMAYGTESITRCDKIFGPGNRYVTEAKQQISKETAAIDMPAGPSEVMIMADDSSIADFVASDMLSQAEHGADSQAIVVADNMLLAQEINKRVEAQVLGLSRSATAVKALEGSRIVVLNNRDDMVAFANMYAAEHLIISMNNEWEICDKITSAGSIFLGNYTPESAGDYASGTNHTLPTYGWAHSCSGVNLDSFIKKITIQQISKEGLAAIGSTVEVMAQAEGLTAHKNAVSIRLKTLSE